VGTFRTIVAVLQSCPSCGWSESRPSPRRGARDFMLAGLFLAPYRCLMCRTRFFRFSIPAGIAIRPDPRIPTAPARPRPLQRDPPAAPPPPARIATPSVLILADDVPVRKLLRRILERDGYQIRELAESAGLALELQARPVDLVIADLDLTPEETILMLKPSLSNPDLRVLVLSSAPLGEVFPSCMVLEKPFRGETLLANVRNALCVTP
jgi:CheY-like chemotaxis protein